MSNSAINTQVAQLKIGSVQNQADSSSVYSNGVWSFKNSTALTSVTITDSGNVGIGTSSPTLVNYGRELSVSSTTGAQPEAFLCIQGAKTSDGNVGALTFFNSASFLGSIAGVRTGANNSGAITFATANLGTIAERMRIDASGNLFLGKTTTGVTQTGFNVEFPTASNPAVFNVINTSGLANTYHFYNQNATNNGYRFYVMVNGGIANFSGNNSNLSDERVKTEINLASNYLEKICSIPVKTFRYKDQGDDMDLTLGVIAQDVERVAPELVNTTDGFGDLPEDGVPLKTIYQTDLQYALMKCIQELKEKNDALEARLAALEAKP